MPLSATGNLSTLLMLVIIATTAVVLAVSFTFASVGRAWIASYLAGVPVPIAQLLGMALRRAPMQLIVDTWVRLRSAGLAIGIESLEKHHRAGGRMARVAGWMVAVRASDLEVPWEQLCVLDLAHQLPDVASVTAREVEQRSASLGRAADGDQPQGS